MLKSIFERLVNGHRKEIVLARTSTKGYFNVGDKLHTLEQNQVLVLELLAAIIKLHEKEIDSMHTLAEALVKATAMVDLAASHKTIEDAANAEIAQLKKDLEVANVAASAVTATVADAATVDAIVAKIDLANATLAGANAVLANTGLVGPTAGLPGAGVPSVMDAPAAVVLKPAVSVDSTVTPAVDSSGVNG